MLSITIGEFFGWLWAAFFAVFIVVSIKRWIQMLLLFKSGHNHYKRICKKCGAHQMQYQSNIEGCESHLWWEECYPIGNNNDCPCHSFAEYHP